MVNLENDIVGKYIGKLIRYGDNEETDAKSGITTDFLIQNGFM